MFKSYRIHAVYLGKRLLLDVLRQTVNLFPRGKQWRFDYSLSHVSRSLLDDASVADLSSQRMITLMVNHRNSK